MKRSIRPIMMIVLAVCLAAAAIPAPTLAANPDVGYIDAPFGIAPGEAPTADKPQSKLWFNDGAWWSEMFNIGDGTYHIYRLTWPNQWVDTLTQVDDRPATHADALWDGAHLYIASTPSKDDGSTPNTSQGRLYRYSYSGGVYTLDAGFPTVIMTGKIESLTIDKDTTGQLWTTFALNQKVYVTYSATDGATWATPFVIPGPTIATTLNSDDISSLVAYTQTGEGRIGVLWSNHNDPSSMYFAYHTDGDPATTWSPFESIYAPEALDCAADDHMNLKSLQSDDSGTIYAAVKTSFGDPGCPGDDNSPLIRLVVRRPDNSWNVSTFGTVGEKHTRPLVLLDTSNRMVYMFATSNTSCGIIYMKSTSMGSLIFPDGKGTPFISSSIHTCINNPTSTKQTVNAASGLVVMASDKNGQVYLHNVLALGSPPVDTTPPTVTARSPLAAASDVEVGANVTATFSEALNPATVSGTSVRLLGPGATSVPATVSYDSTSETITLNPSADLSFNTTYTVQLTVAIKDPAGNALVPVSWDFTTAAVPDTTPPTVAAQSPLAAAGNVTVATNVLATFSEDLNPATISSTSVRLLDPSAASVPATISYDAASQTVRLSPSADLSFSTTYTAQLTGAITDLAGNPLAPVSWSFTTAAVPDTTPPTVTARSPLAAASNVAVASNATATFSEQLDAASISTSSVRLLGPGAASVPAAVNYDAASHMITLDPSATLNFNTTYTVQLTGVITDLTGNPLVPVSWSFTTAAAADTTPPAVTAKTPNNGANNISVSASVTATFSEPIDSASISSTSFKLVAGSSTVAASVSYNPATRTATLQPSSALVPGTIYTATVVGVKDLAGNTMTTPVIWGFISAAAPAPSQKFVFLPLARR